MKKLLLSLLAFGSIYSASAQAPLVNGDFEAAFQTSPYPNYNLTSGWGGGIYKSETTSPGQALQSLKLETVLDPSLNAAFTANGGGFATDTLPGFAIQEANGDASTWQGATVSFMFKHDSISLDTAVFLVQIYDTLQAGWSDDVLLNEGFFAVSNNVATWTTQTMTLDAIPNATGTPNQIYIIATTSYGAFLTGTTTPALGNTLWIDDVKRLSGAGIEEKAISTVKVFPNPANDVLNIQADGEVSNITITSLEGKVVKTTTDTTIDVSTLNAGVYIYSVVVNGEVKTGNFVKK